MQFIHLADTHLGYRQYGLQEREADFYSAFERAIDKILEIRPDFVIHSGDLFEFSRSPPRALVLVQESLERLKEAGIRTYAIAGNHDMVQRKKAIPPQAIFKNMNLKLISAQKDHFIHGGVFIGGTPYTSRYFVKLLHGRLDKLTKKAEKYSKKILILHQGIDTYLPFGSELKIGDLPDNFNYYAMGHIHKRILDDFGEGKLAYAGSTEIWSKDELASYNKVGKGMFLVDLGGDMPDVQNINLELKRNFIKEEIFEEDYEVEVNRIKNLMEDREHKPVLYLDINCSNDLVNKIHQHVVKELSPNVLQLRPNYKFTEEEIFRKSKLERLDIKTLIKEECGNRNQFFELSNALFDAFAENNSDLASDIVKKAYKEFQ